MDEEYFFFFEETDWAYRMKEAGWRIFFVPEARIYHAQGKSVGGSAEARIMFYRSRFIFFRKWTVCPPSPSVQSTIISCNSIARQDNTFSTITGLWANICPPKDRDLQSSHRAHQNSFHFLLCIFSNFLHSRSQYGLLHRE